MAINRLFDTLTDKIFKHADVVRIELHRYEGQLCLNYKIEGGIGPDLEDDADTLEPVDTRFVRELLDRFESEGGAV